MIRSDELSRPQFTREQRSGLRLIFAWRPSGRAEVFEGLSFHCAEALGRWLGGEDHFDPTTFPLAYRRFGSWREAEGWLRNHA